MKKNNTLVSIMIPVYNAESFIAECIDSILCQSYKNIELIIGDDFSTDNTVSVVESYLKIDDRIKFIKNNKNLGITRNCNNILLSCRGNYVVLFAGDDVMLPGKIEKQLKFMLENSELSMSYHSVELFQSETNKTIEYTDDKFKFRNVYSIIEKMGIPGPMSIMVKTSALPEGFFNDNFKYVSDWILQIEIAINGPIGYFEGVWCRYRKYGVNNGKNLNSYEDEFPKALFYIENRYPTYPGIKKSCKKGYARYLIGKAYRIYSQNKDEGINIALNAFKVRSTPLYLASYLILKTGIKLNTLQHFRKYIRKII